MPSYTREQVLAFAPDPASAKAGQGQAAAARWPLLGVDDGALWGECTGSGKLPYRAQVDLSDAASACSCPSRKFPCKHAIGLLLLYADGTVARGERPAWVQEWLAGRSARAAARTQRATQPAETAVDPAATAKRAASRERKVDAGVAEIQRWLDDLERTGLAVAQGQPWSWWESTAARMVDAQAKGLANQVHAMAATAASGGHRPDWPARLLDQAGGLVLLARAWRHRDALPEPTAAALRSRLGFVTSTEQVLADGERLTDRWAVVGRRFGEQDRIRSLQQWLVGRQSGRVVTLLSFAAAAVRLDPGLPVGCLVEAELALYPGTCPHRALVVERRGQPVALDALPAAPTWAAALGAVAPVLATDPWADEGLLSAAGVRLLPPEAEGSWSLVDREGAGLPVDPTADCWPLLALSGGEPFEVAVLWDGFAARPLSAGRPVRVLT
ncbi:MAG: SWIM zinc finger domain-containing protein [Actinobacteria bacterium]|nr:SWIM zinc finger domain-containing protein [Actinomycetota bacterium]